MTAPALRVGTSGFAYRTWIPAFYPPGTRTKDLLAAYAARLPAVELNHTYYRMPTASASAGWRAQVHDGFRFAVKAPMFLTVRKAAFDPRPVVDELAAALAPLGPTLGCLLLQFPAHIARDDLRLDALLAAMPAGWRCACEFEHASWRSDDVDGLLVRRGATRVLRDEEGAVEQPFAARSRWQYVRLRRDDYDDAALAAWRRRLDASGAEEAFVFFRHEDRGHAPALAQRLLAVRDSAERARAPRRRAR